MPFVRQTALFLNISIPIYFCYHQIVNSMNHPDHQSDEETQNKSMLIEVITACIVLISPIFHILALKHPSYCFKGHCPAPQHCTHQDDQAENKYNPNIYNKPKNYLNRQHVQFRSKQKDKSHNFGQQHDDFIKESNASSKDENPFNQKYFANLSKTKQTHQKNDLDNGMFLKLHKIQSPSLFEKQFPQEQKQQQNHRNEITNVNEFSNIPFFRASRRSLSNIGNNDSPRISRKSVTQPQQILVEPLIINTPRKRSSTPQLTPKKLVQSHFSSQATQILPRMKIQCEYCEDCQIPKYLRMKHCYRCQKCVHKYDHHCVLLDICIGEANQKYYIAFLYANMYNTLLVLRQLLKMIKDDVFLDQVTGIEYLENGYTFKAFAIILLILNLILTGYLVFIHTKFLFNGQTTYQKQRRDTINFFRFIKKNFYLIEALKNFDQDDLETYHPFNEGFFINACKIITASEKPYDWQLPFKEFDTCIELKQRKEKAKLHSEGKNDHINFLGREWGEESESSNNLHAGKTTKSRESAVRKSKQDEEKPFEKLKMKG